jgi:hypothetical protein
MAKSGSKFRCYLRMNSEGYTPFWKKNQSCDEKIAALSQVSPRLFFYAACASFQARDIGSVGEAATRLVAQRQTPASKTSMSRCSGWKGPMHGPSECLYCRHQRGWYLCQSQAALTPIKPYFQEYLAVGHEIGL